MFDRRFVLAAVGIMFAIGAAVTPVSADEGDRDERRVRSVLLVSIDGRHAFDFANCSRGIKGLNGDAPYCPRLAELAQRGITYTDATSSKPSDSFPGLLALITGGSPRSTGVYYDASYDRALSPPAQ